MLLIIKDNEMITIARLYHYSSVLNNFLKTILSLICKSFKFICVKLCTL